MIHIDLIILLQFLTLLDELHITDSMVYDTVD